jgi:MFS family permease
MTPDETTRMNAGSDHAIVKNTRFVPIFLPGSVLSCVHPRALIRRHPRSAFTPTPMPQRYVVVAVTALAALLLYIDRVCISILADPIRADLALTDQEKELALSAFFLTYALFQIPVGALADRYGPRLVLAASIAAWSAVTALTGLAWSFGSLLAARLLLGVAEAGAYPAAAVLVKRWARPEERGWFSSLVAIGGRVGGAFAPALTTTVGKALVGVGVAGVAVGESAVNWRGVFVLYGACGFAVAAVFWALVRDRPPGWPAVAPPPPPPDDDPDWHALPPAPAAAPAPFGQQLAALAGSRGMWFFGTVQFCNNISWAFLVTLLPTYLKDADVDLGLRSRIQTGVLLAGCGGMILGGLVTDAARRRFGPRWGRSLPIAAMMACCAAMCGVVSSSPGLWVAVGALAVMAMCQDLGIPSVWAYAQDVGGRSSGAALGFGNMLGNLGAALSPVLLGAVSRAGGWEAAFALCAACYATACACGLTLDASRPVADD